MSKAHLPLFSRVSTRLGRHSFEKPPPKAPAPVIQEGDARQHHAYEALTPGDGGVALAEQFIEVSVSASLNGVPVLRSEKLALLFDLPLGVFHLLSQLGPLSE